MKHDYSILVVEDDPALQHLMSAALETSGYFHQMAQTVAEGIGMAAQMEPGVILLDLGLPDGDGLEVIKRVRTWSEVPIIVISARGEDGDKIIALDAGADDYLTKPFSVEELLARIRVAIRRLTNLGQPLENAAYFNGNLTIDYAAGNVLVAGQEVHLTPNEYRLLVLLAQNTGKVLTHTFILNHVWGSTLKSDMASLRVTVATLRKKLARQASAANIQTHVGIGYRMMRAE